MIYEGTIVFIAADKNGNDKAFKQMFLLENYETFREVEDKLFLTFNELEPDVVAIRRSPLKEIINECPANDTKCKIYFATIIDKFYDVDKDEDIERKYTVALHAHDISEAHQEINQYMEQGFADMELVGLKCTKFLGVLK